MKAVRFTGLSQQLVLEQLPDPTPGEGEVVVRVARCGICGSDLHMAEDPAFGAAPGDVFGHEFAGEVVALGKGTEGLATGDLVSVIPLKSCGHCDHCRKGEVQWCAGFGLQGGGYAEYAVTRPNQCVKLPKTASLADGAIIEPLAVALHGRGHPDIDSASHLLALAVSYRHSVARHDTDIGIRRELDFIAAALAWAKARCSSRQVWISAAWAAAARA